MTTWFITRHPGALAWAKRQGLWYDRHEEHLELDEIQAGDTVIGILPMGLAAGVCEKGARFIALEISTPLELRGKELGADALERLNCRLRQYDVRKMS